VTTPPSTAETTAQTLDPNAPLRSVPQLPLLDFARRALTGQFTSNRVNMLGALQGLQSSYGDVIAAGFGPARLLHLFGPDANRTVLLDRDRIFSARKPWMQIMGRIFPNGLLLMDGDQHKQHRKIMHLAFKRPELRGYAARMNPMIDAALAAWPTHGKLRAFDAYKQLTLDMATRIFVGADLGEGARTMNHHFENLVAASMSVVRLPIPGLEFQRGLAGRRYMVDLFGGMIATKREGEGEDIFARLCRAETEEGERFTDQEIIDHMSFLMMAAHDTTTSTLTSMTYELARHPEWQERLREESRAVGKQVLELGDLEGMQGLDLVMKETLRRYPPLPVIPRVASEDFEFQGYAIPAGTMVIVAPIHTHHLEEWWDEPTRFDPERFSAARAEHERHSHSWIPFGGGPHMCLGLRFAETQVKLIMHQLLLRRRISVPDGYVMPVQQAPISKPLDGLPIELTPIEAA